MYDFRPDSLHRTTGRLSNDQYMASKAVEDLPLPMLYGVHLSRFLHDTTHSQLLGTSKVLNGSVLTYLCEAGEFGMFPAGIYDSALSQLLPIAFANFKDYLKANHLQCTQPRFTAARLNRRHRGQFPCLASKAVNGKRISYWLASKCLERCNRLGGDATELDMLVMATAWSYCAMLQQFENCNIVLTEAEAATLHRFGMTHLLTYSALRNMSSRTSGRVVNRSSWPVIPKHHHLQHALDDAKETLNNPGSYHLLAAESWVGIVGRMSRCHGNQPSTFGRLMFSEETIYTGKTFGIQTLLPSTHLMTLLANRTCHRKTVTLRTIQRYLVMFRTKLRGAKKQLRGSADS